MSAISTNNTLARVSEWRREGGGEGRRGEGEKGGGEKGGGKKGGGEKGKGEKGGGEKGEILKTCSTPSYSQPQRNYTFTSTEDGSSTTSFFSVRSLHEQECMMMSL